MPDTGTLTVEDMIRAGALSQLCNYHRSIGGRESDWPRVEVFALREFPTIDPFVIRSLVESAKKASCAARIQMGLNASGKLRHDDIP